MQTIYLAGRDSLLSQYSWKDSVSDKLINNFRCVSNRPSDPISSFDESDIVIFNLEETSLFDRGFLYLYNLACELNKEVIVITNSFWCPARHVNSVKLPSLQFLFIYLNADPKL